MGRRTRIKVAIVGGGCAAISTAFELSRPVHGGKYDITVYQLAWVARERPDAGRLNELKSTACTCGWVSMTTPFGCLASATPS